MLIGFKTDELEMLCTDDKEADKAFGRACRKKLRRRLDDLKRASTLQEMRQQAGRCHELKGDFAGCLAVDVHGGVRLVFAPGYKEPPLKPDGGLDWRAVECLDVVYLGDYHD